jgi:hypothetical protein
MVDQQYTPTWYFKGIRMCDKEHTEGDVCAEFPKEEDWTVEKYSKGCGKKTGLGSEQCL